MRVRPDYFLMTGNSWSLNNAIHSGATWRFPSSLDSQYLPFLWLVKCLWRTRWVAHPFPLHPSTRSLSPHDLCIFVSSHRFPQCLLFWARATTSWIFSFMHLLLFTSRLAVAFLDWRAFPCKPLVWHSQQGYLDWKRTLGSTNSIIFKCTQVGKVRCQGALR